MDNLWSILKIFALSHWQAFTERGFSLSSGIAFSKNNTPVTFRQIADVMKNKSIVEIAVSMAMIDSCRHFDLR